MVIFIRKLYKIMFDSHPLEIAKIIKKKRKKGKN